MNNLLMNNPFENAHYLFIFVGFLKSFCCKIFQQTKNFKSLTSLTAWFY